MEDDKYFNQVIDSMKDRLDKSENAIENIKDEIELLKLSNVEVKIKLSSIELSQEQIKNMINETAKDNQKVIIQLLDTIREDRENKNKIKIQDRKELWGILGIILAAVITWLGSQ